MTNGTDILAYAKSKAASFPNGGSLKVRIMNAVNAPTGTNDSDFWYEIIYISVDTKWIRIIAHDVRTRFTYANALLNDAWFGWGRTDSIGLREKVNVDNFTNVANFNLSANSTDKRVMITANIVDDTYSTMVMSFNWGWKQIYLDGFNKKTQKWERLITTTDPS